MDASFRGYQSGFLASTEVIDWQHSDVRVLAWLLASGASRADRRSVLDESCLGRISWRPEIEIARRCFVWVRDEIEHSADYRRREVTCRASDVLARRTGFCYAKSHLLAALLRANGIPAGFCYQRLSIDGGGAPFCVHGLNAVWLPELGWYRVDARGNRHGDRATRVDAQFMPPVERLAFAAAQEGEEDLPGVYAEPLGEVVDVLGRYDCARDVQANLPDVATEPRTGALLVRG